MKKLVDAVNWMSTWTYTKFKGQGHSLTLVQGHSNSAFWNFFPDKPLGRLKPNFMWSLRLMGERKFVQMVQVPWPSWLPCPYMVKTWKILLLWNQRADDLECWMQHWVLEYYQVGSNDEPGLTFTYFTAMSNLVPYAFVWKKKVKTMEYFRNYYSLWYKIW